MAHMSQPTSQGLSKNTMMMKFMQRSVFASQIAESAEPEVENEEHWKYERLPADLPPVPPDSWQVEASLGRSRCCRFTRFSFGGMNPEVERIMAAKSTERINAGTRAREAEGTVGDLEMAERYTSLIGSIAGKFERKRSRSDGSRVVKKQKNDDDERVAKLKSAVSQFLAAGDSGSGEDST